MIYTDYLETLTVCPFCDPKERIILDSNSAYLTYAKAPYHKHHILIIPKRHTESFLDLTEEETIEINNLTHSGVKMLQLLGYDDYSILVRNGNGCGKSIKHLHYHIVPKIHIGNTNYGGEARMVMNDSEIETVLNDFESIKSTI